ncbi:hypothetical protein R1sor_009199 [Riccia sorocarpa]|uniref:Uncharacterized protein n=1 Tax=Riccia sorocarpa TaxID=122646 RepID=A0ABD3H535_9MARC
MENGAGFHICPFDELGNYVDVMEEDKSKWDDLWRMESDAFDEECKYVSGENYEEPWHPRIRCVIMIPPVRAYKQIEVAMHNLNTSSHTTVRYDWIQDAERCLQVLSSLLIDYKEMIGDDVYDEFEKSR